MLREWKLHLKFGLKREGASPVYVQITHGLIAEIRRGRLSPREVLPGSREMAEELGVNRKTVVVAYDELIAQGWLTSRRHQGNVRFDEAAGACEQAGQGRSQQFKSPRGCAAVQPVLLRRSTFRSFFQSQVSFFSTTALRIQGYFRRRVLHVPIAARCRSQGKVGKLGYGDPRGSPVLRTAISHMLNVDRGLATSPERVCLTARKSDGHLSRVTNSHSTR